MPLLYKLKIYLELLQKKSGGYYDSPDDLFQYIPAEWRTNSDNMSQVEKKLEFVSFDNLTYAVVTISDAIGYFGDNNIKVNFNDEEHIGKTMKAFAGPPNKMVSMIEIFDCRHKKPIRKRTHNRLAYHACLNITDNTAVLTSEGHIFTCSHNEEHSLWIITQKTRTGEDFSSY